MKRAALLLIVALAACSKDKPTQVNTQIPTTLIIGASQTVLIVGGTATVTATVYDQSGKIIPGAQVDWESLEPTVATVTSAGIVTGVTVGSVVIRATIGDKSTETTLTVDPDPCTTPVSLSVGQVKTFSGPQAVACITLAATTGPTDYLFVTANAEQSLDNLAFYSVNLTQASALSGSLAASMRALDPRQILEQQDLEQVDETEARVREQERSLLPRLKPQLRSANMSVVASGGASAAVAPSAGDTVTYRVPKLNSSNLCTNYTDVRAVVKKVGQHALIAQDVTAPTGGFTQSDFESIASEFDNLTFGTDTLYFGGVTDRNNDGHVTILYTSEVNASTPSGSTSFTAGFFWGGDLVLRSEYQAANLTCPQTNEQEIFYMLVPDPNGIINGNARSVDIVRQNTRGTIAHEFQHMINQGRRLLNPAVDSTEKPWLNEALSHLAEEIVGRAYKGFGDLQELSYSDVNPNPNAADDYNAFFKQNLLRLRTWQTRPDTSSPISIKAINQLAPRGAAWQLLRYAADHYSGGNIKAFLRGVVGGPDVGLRNLLQHTGAQYDDLLAGFLVSQYTDGAGVPGLSPQFTIPTWNIRDASAGANNGTFPLLVTPLPNVIATQSLSGSGNYFRLTRPDASPETTFRMVAPSGTLVGFSAARVYVVRLQ